MMKRKKNNIDYSKLVVFICSLFFGIVAIVIWALPVLKFQQVDILLGSTVSDITGFQLVFGGTIYRNVPGPFEPTPIPLCPSPLATVGFFLIVGGFITSIISFILNLKNKTKLLFKILTISSCALFLAGGIISFFLEQAFKMSYQEDLLTYFKDKIVSDFNVAPFIAIIAIVCSLITAIQFIYFKKSKKAK